MATDIVQSLFGVTPEAYQRQQAALLDRQALQFAQLDPMAQATYGIYRGAGQLGGALGRALGGEDPELARISVRQQIAGQLNPNDLTTFDRGIEMMRQAGDGQGAMMLAMEREKVRQQALVRSDEALVRADAAAKRQREAAALLQQQEAQAIAQRAFVPAGQPAFYGTPSFAPQVDEQGNLMPGAGVTAAPSFDVSRVAAELMRTPAGRAELKNLTEAQKLTRPETISVKQEEILYEVPTKPGGEYKAIVVGGAKPTPFTGDMANASNILYQTTDPQKIFSRFGQEGLNAVAKKAEQLVEAKRPVTNITNPVTVNMQKGFGEDLVGTITANQKAARTALSTLGTVDNMKMLLDEGVKTGFGQETLLKLGQAGQLFDPNFNTRGLAGQEAFQAFSTQIVLPQVKQLGVNPTDTDLKFINTGSAGLSKTVDGNKLLLDTLALKLQREQDLGKFSNQWLATNSRLVKTDPIEAQSKYNTDFDAYTQSSPLYGPAANTLRARYSALGGNVRGSPAARGAAQAGGFTR